MDTGRILDLAHHSACAAYEDRPFERTVLDCPTSPGLASAVVAELSVAVVWPSVDHEILPTLLDLSRALCEDDAVLVAV